MGDNGSHSLTPENVPNPRARKRPRRPERPGYWGAIFFNFRPMTSALLLAKFNLEFEEMTVCEVEHKDFAGFANRTVSSNQLFW